jgi:hypothetical protein
MPGLAGVVTNNQALRAFLWLLRNTAAGVRTSFGTNGKINRCMQQQGASFLGLSVKSICH